MQQISFRTTKFTRKLSTTTVVTYFSLLLNKMLSSKHHRLIGYPNNNVLQNITANIGIPNSFKKLSLFRG